MCLQAFQLLMKQNWQNEEVQLLCGKGKVSVWLGLTLYTGPRDRVALPENWEEVPQDGEVTRSENKELRDLVTEGAVQSRNGLSDRGGAKELRKGGRANDKGRNGYTKEF